MPLTLTEISAVQLVKNNPVPVKVFSDKRPKEKSNPIFDFLFVSTTANDGEAFTITYDSISVTMTFRDTPDTSTGLDIPTYTSGTLTEFVDDVRDAMIANPDLYKYFVFSRTTVGVLEYITLALRNQYDTDAAVTKSENVDGLTLTITQTTNSNYVENQHLVLIVDKQPSGSDNSEITHILPVVNDATSPFVIFDIHTDFNLNYHLPNNSFLNSGSPFFDGAEDCYQKFSMRYANHFGDPPTTQALQSPTTSEYLALWGTKSYINTLDNWYAIKTGEGNDAVWLTDQPRTKEVTEAQPEFWYFLPINAANKDYIVKKKEYYLDATDATATLATVNADWGEVQLLKLGFTQLGLTNPSPTNPIIKYDIWIEVDAVIESEVITFEVVNTQTSWERFFAFGNSLASIETVRMTGKFEEMAEYTGKEGTQIDPTVGGDFARQGSLFLYDKRQTRKWKGNTGLYDDKTYIQYLKELLLSDSVWYIDNDTPRFIAVVVTPGSVKMQKDNDDLYSLDFEYQFAHEDKGNA